MVWLFGASQLGYEIDHNIFFFEQINHFEEFEIFGQVFSSLEVIENMCLLYLIIFDYLDDNQLKVTLRSDIRRPISLAIVIYVIKASCSTWLLLALNSNIRNFSMKIFPRPSSTTPTLISFRFVYKQGPYVRSFLAHWKLNSARKYVKHMRLYVAFIKEVNVLFW